MKYIHIIILTIVTFNCYSQKALKPIKVGIYSGGICIDEGICGYWILKSDSTFAFIEFENTIVKKIGIGRILNRTNSNIKLNFNRVNNSILLKSKVEYLSKSVLSYDSVFLKGRLMNDRNEPIKFASIVYNSKYGTSSNDSGYFHGKFPRLNGLNYVLISKKIENYSPISILLNPNNNLHELNISMPITDSLSCISINEIEKLDNTYEFKIVTNKNDKKTFLSLHFISSNLDQIKKKLVYAKEIQLLASKNIQEIINFIDRK